MSGGVEARIYQIAITTEELRALDGDERQLVLLIGHAANEIAALYRAAHASGMGNSADADRFNWQVSQSQTLLMLRLTAGKIYELFRVIDKQKLDGLIRNIYPEFDEIRRQIEERIERSMPLRKWRNRFGFHYGANFFAKIDESYFGAIPDGFVYEIVFERKGVNTFFAFSEVYFQHVLAANLSEPKSYLELQSKIIPGLVHDFLTMINKLITAIHHVIVGVFGGKGVRLDDKARHNEDVATFITSKDVMLPGFIAFRGSTVLPG